MAMAEVPEPSRRSEREEAKRRRKEATPVWRERLVPKTVLGMSTIILAFAVGAAFSGVAFYAYYEKRLTENEKFNLNYKSQFDDEFKKANDTIKAETVNGQAAIQKEIEPLKRLAASGDTLSKLLEKAGPSTFFVQTQDEAGQPSVGSAFSVATDSKQTLLLTSYTTIRAATRQPGPQIIVRKGETQTKATLWTWHEEKDLALLVIPTPNVPALKFASGNPALRLGERVFAVSGLGGGGGAVTQGFVADVSAAGIMHDASIGQAFQGGPLLNSEGNVLGVASRSFAPLGYASDGVWFAVPGKAACEKVLKCPNGEPSAAGDKRSG
jgi:S1-C subfamily serine protease